LTTKKPVKKNSPKGGSFRTVQTVLRQDSPLGTVKNDEPTLTSIPKEEQPYDIPQGWVWVKWKVCGSLTAGNGFSPSMQGFEEYDIPFYKVGSLKLGDSYGILYDTANTINDNMRKKMKATLIPKNSVIFAKIGEAIRLNRRCLNDRPCCIDNNLIAFSTNETCLHKYVYYWSCNQEFYGLAKATTVPAIRKSDLENMPFPLPPLAEQEEIVRRLDSIFEKEEKTKKLCNMIEKIELMKKAILAHAFRGELTG